MMSERTYSEEEMRMVLEALLAQRKMVHDEVKEADERAGQAWRLLRRYKRKVRELNETIERMKRDVESNDGSSGLDAADGSKRSDDALHNVGASGEMHHET